MMVVCPSTHGLLSHAYELPLMHYYAFITIGKIANSSVFTK